jgi:hypothetical protein
MARTVEEQNAHVVLVGSRSTRCRMTGASNQKLADCPLPQRKMIIIARHRPDQKLMVELKAWYLQWQQNIVPPIDFTSPTLRTMFEVEFHCFTANGPNGFNTFRTIIMHSNFNRISRVKTKIKFCRPQASPISTLYIVLSCTWQSIRVRCCSIYNRIPNMKYNSVLFAPEAKQTMERVPETDLFTGGLSHQFIL